MTKQGKISNNCDLQDFIWDTIMSQKESFNEDEIVKIIHNSGRVDSDYDSNRLKELVIEKISLLLRLNTISYSPKEDKYFVKN